MSDANRPDPAEPHESAQPDVGDPGASVAPLEPEAAGDEVGPKVERMDVDPEAGEHLETELSSDAVTVRRSPRYGSFLLLGAALGVLVALVLTFAFPENPDFDRGQVFGFLLLWCGAGGLALGGAAALVIDRVLAKRRGTAVAEHESTHYVDDEPAG
ncbi:hypothetical protein [Agromyces sp. GXS1127]|uniref:hypothetical protein n=1 Tax=Agromyces sp. GXS1127 TaxID=3424181 RepID=UPI003D31C4D8